MSSLHEPEGRVEKRGLCTAAAAAAGAVLAVGIVNAFFDMP